MNLRGGPTASRSSANRSKTPGDSVIIFQGHARPHSGIVKSLEGFKAMHGLRRAQTLSAVPMSCFARQSAPGSELWWSWNPRRKE